MSDMRAHWRQDVADALPLSWMTALAMPESIVPQCEPVPREIGLAKEVKEKRSCLSRGPV